MKFQPDTVPSPERAGEKSVTAALNIPTNCLLKEWRHCILKAKLFCDVDVEPSRLPCVCFANYPTWISGFRIGSGRLRIYIYIYIYIYISMCVCLSIFVCGTTLKHRNDDSQSERFSK
jgi:hypothetical protein